WTGPRDERCSAGARRGGADRVHEHDDIAAGERRCPLLLDRVIDVAPARDAHHGVAPRGGTEARAVERRLDAQIDEPWAAAGAARHERSDDGVIGEAGG